MLCQVFDSSYPLSTRMAALATYGSSDSLDITGARAVVEWSKHDGQACHLSSPSDSESLEVGQVTFDCHFRPSSSSASLRLRAPILLKGFGRKATPLFMFIAPERIRSIGHHAVDKAHVSDNVRKILGDGGITSLRFTLNQPADLVAPTHSSLVPKKKVFWTIFDSLKMLAQETNFVIYLSQKDYPSENSLVPFCDAVSAGGLTTSTPHADVSRLYDGEGGRVLTGADLALPDALPIESPPSYDDAGPPPPAPPIEKGKRHYPFLPLAHANVGLAQVASSDQGELAGSTRKRRRTSSTAGDCSTHAPPRNDSATDTAHMEAVCRKLMGEMTAKWREDGEQLRSELRQTETRIKGWVDERLSKHVDDIREELRRTSVQQQNQMCDQVQEVRLELQEVRDEVQGIDERSEEVMEEVQKFRDDTSDLVDGRLDERLEGLQSELEEYVAEELHNAEDRVIERLRSSVYVDFGIYD